MKYLSIDGELLKNKTIPAASKLIISFMINLRKGGKCFYGTHAYLSETLGIRYEYLEKCMSALLKSGILKVTDEGITCIMNWEVICSQTWSSLC
jgi:hypothetical protein